MPVETQTADTGVAPDEAYTSIQHSDEATSTQVSTLVGHENLADYADGLRVADGSVDWDAGTFDLTDGKAFWLIDEISDRPSDDHSWHKCLFVSYYPGVAGVSFDVSDGAGKQHVFARCDGVALGTAADSPKIDVRDDPEPQSEDSLRIATFDPDSQRVIYHNRAPDALFERLEADEVVIREALDAEGVVDTEALADEAVTNAKLADNASDQRTTAPESIGSEELIDESIQSSDIDNRAVGDTEIGQDAVNDFNLAANAVQTSSLHDNVVANRKVLDRTLRGEKLADSTIGTRPLASRSVTPSILDQTRRYRMAGLTTNDPTVNTSQGGLQGSSGGASGEVRRLGGADSDTVEMVEGGDGYYYLAYNARQTGDGDWEYTTDGEPAMAIGMGFAEIRFWTAGLGTAGETIDWARVSASGNAVDNSRALGGVDADQYLRKRGVVDIRQGELTLLNHDSVSANTSRDIVWENQPSGDRIKLDYTRPEMRLHAEGRYHNPIWTAHKNGAFRPASGVVYPDNGTPFAPRQTSVLAYYYNGDLRVVRDDGLRGQVPIDWS